MQHWIVYYEYEGGEDGTYFGPFFEEEEAVQFIAKHPPEIGGWESAEAYCVNSPFLIETAYE